MGVKLGLSPKGTNICWGCLRTILRRIFGSYREEWTELWRKLHNEELHDLYSSQNVIGLNKSRKMRWTRRVERIEDVRNACCI